MRVSSRANHQMIREQLPSVFHYAQADILRSEASEQIIAFVKFWKKVHGKLTSTLVFDSKLTSYEHLDGLNDMNIQLITLRKRGKKLLAGLEQIPHSHWQKLRLDIPKRKLVQSGGGPQLVVDRGCSPPTLNTYTATKSDAGLVKGTIDSESLT